MSDWPLWVTFAPLVRWPGTLNQWREPSPFSSKRSQTLRDLRKELDFLGAGDVLFRVAVSPADIRRDNRLRAGARVAHPGVLLEFSREPKSKQFGTVSQALSFLQQQANEPGERNPARLYKLASVRGAHPDVGGSRELWLKIVEAHRLLTDKDAYEIGVDKFTTMDANLRAIALALHDLRRLKRYGVAQDDQHLAGFRAAIPQTAGA